MSADILADIAAYKREEVRDRRRRTSTAGIEAAAKAASPPRGFRAALERARHATAKKHRERREAGADPTQGKVPTIAKPFPVSSRPTF